MLEVVKDTLKQPYWVIALALGVVLVVLPSVTINEDHSWSTHSPTPMILVWIGIGLLILSAVAFWAMLRAQHATARAGADGGLDLARVKASKGVHWTTVGRCEIRVVSGRIEEQADDEGTVVVLPCNEYFDDRCVEDTKSALGAYVNNRFEGRVSSFIDLMKEESQRRLGPGTVFQKTDDESAESFGAGRCVLLARPLGRSAPIALVSTTTQRAGVGLTARIAYLLDGMSKLVARLADERFRRIMMPVLGAGHGDIAQPLAFVALLLAIADSVRYGEGGHRLKKVTIVVFKANEHSPAEVGEVVVQRALALVGDPLGT